MICPSSPLAARRSHARGPEPHLPRPAAVMAGSLRLWRSVTVLPRKAAAVCSYRNYRPLTTSGNVQTPPGKVLVESRHCRRVMGWPLS
jgi:hypothetical protein